MPSSPSQSAPIVLCIDDQQDSLGIRKLFLETFGYSVITASSGPEGLEQLAASPVDAVLLDYRMPGMDGEEVACIVRRRWPDIPILMLTGYPRELPASVRALVDDIIIKGGPPADLLEALQRVVGRTPKKPSAGVPEVPRTVAEHVSDVRRHVQRGREHKQFFERRKKDPEAPDAKD